MSKVAPNFLLPTSAEFLRLQAGRRGHAGGIIFEGRHITYGELAQAVDGLARWLARRGLGAGHHVGVLAGNAPAIVAMEYAVWSLGAVVVPISIRSTESEGQHLLAHSRADAVLCDNERAAVARSAAEAGDIPAFVCEPDFPLKTRILRRRSPRREKNPVPPRPETLAAITYTSGTTGSPKGVMVTHGNLMWAMFACSQARGDTPETVGAAISALTHTPVLISHVLCRILLGSTTVLFRKFDTATILEATERFRITDLSLIAGMVFEVISMKAVPEGVRRALKKVTVGGAPTPMSAKRRLAEIFPGSEIMEAYGQSEATDGVTMARGTSVFDREGTVGRPNPHVIVAIRRSDGSFAPPGEEGEIIVGGPTVMAGYYRNPGVTAKTIRRGWLHTGDLGYQDADGYLFLTGRVKDLIITGGENVAPREVEDVLRLHPGVADVAVIGTPHVKWGEQVTAVVVRRLGADLDAESLAAFAATRLAGFKKPRRVEFVDVLPRNAAKKVQTNVLKEMFAATARGEE